MEVRNVGLATESTTSARRGCSTDNDERRYVWSVPEHLQGGRDLDGNGMAIDRVIHVLGLSDGSVYNLELAALPVHDPAKQLADCCSGGS